MPPVHSDRLIACGMYAFTEPLRKAWSTLLAPLGEIIKQIDPETKLDPLQISFDADDNMVRSSRLLIAHTCGYPYMTLWKPTHQAICVPEFDIPGCNGSQYSSWFVCRSDDQRDSIEAFAGTIAAINGPNSNSGMNVLRYQVSQHAKSKRFFSDVLTTGGHLNSIHCVANGEADIAAIDAVSYHHILRSDPSLAHSTKVMGQSVHTTGLPFIVHRDEKIPSAVIYRALNHCVEISRHNVLDSIGLVRFNKASESDYEPILRLEKDAAAAGYPEVR
ncbi:MAG: phosphate/phosphite/phosphonate ABC transporter substrate-binding protein [bacterium]